MSSPVETNPQFAIRMHDVFNAGLLAGFSHASHALMADPIESAYEASERLAADRAEDEREKFIAGFYWGIDGVLNPKPRPFTGLRF